MQKHTRTFITAGAIALALGLTGCATPAAENTSATVTPSVSATPTPTPAPTPAWEPGAEAEAAWDEVTLMIDYRKVISDFQELLDDLQEYVDDDDEDAAIGLGNDFVLAAMKGRKLEDAPDLGRAGNKAWDKAMDDYQVMGGALQMGMFTMAGDSMNDATANIEVAAAAMRNA